jgi:hypothetical protein
MGIKLPLQERKLCGSGTATLIKTRGYLEPIAALDRVDPDRAEDGNDLPQVVAGHLQAVHVLDCRALHTNKTLIILSNAI